MNIFFLSLLSSVRGTAAWRAWRPTRFARPIRVKGHHVLHATVLLTEDILVASSSNAMLSKNFQHNSKVLQIFVFSVPPTVLFSNELLEDLEKIWALRFVIPDPKNPKCT